MKTKITLPFVFILSLFTLQSCFSPQNIVKLEPEKEGGKWRYGQHFVADSIQGVIYEVGFEQLHNERYWFDFNIVNRSNMPVMIDPTDFYCQPFDRNMQPLTDEKVRAVDPEKEILETEKELSKIEAREANHIGLSLLAAGADIASGIAVATDDNPHNNHLRTHLYHHSLATRAHHSFEAENLTEVMDAWKSSTIRKTTLETNYAMQGKVFFPAFREATYIKLYLPVDNQYVELQFKQIQFPVN
ncbi:MAG: hypothetical protein ACOCWK_02080 [Tangfeifania sp.]